MRHTDCFHRSRKSANEGQSSVRSWALRLNALPYLDPVANVFMPTALRLFVDYEDIVAPDPLRPASRLQNKSTWPEIPSDSVTSRDANL